MSISYFARHLFETGTAFAEPWEAQADVSNELTEIITQAHLLARAEAAYESPVLDLDAAVWSLNVLAWGCSLFVDRTDVTTEFPKLLADREPKGDSPAEHWSADLGFRFFHSLIVRCQHVGPYDSLLQQLVAVGNRWPLATVGVQAEVSTEKLELLLSDKCLRSVLVNRVVERNDEALAKHPLLLTHIAHAVGAQPSFKSWTVNRKKY